MKVDWLVAKSATMGPKLSALVDLLDSASPLRFSKSQALFDQLLGVQISFVTAPKRIEWLPACQVTSPFNL